MEALGNLFMLAGSIIPLVTIQFEKFIDNETTPSGQKQPKWSAATDFPASVQEVGKDVFFKLGLSMQKNYRSVFTTADAFGLEKLSTSDRLIIDGSHWNVINSTPWIGYDGWVQVIVCEDKEYVKV